LESSDDEKKKKPTERTVETSKKIVEKLLHLKAELKLKGKKLTMKNRINLKNHLKFLQGK